MVAGEQRARYRDRIHALHRGIDGRVQSLARQGEKFCRQFERQRVNAGRWIIGYVGTWFLLSLLAEADDTAELAAALAISIALAATFVLGPRAAANIYYTGRES